MIPPQETRQEATKFARKHCNGDVQLMYRLVEAFMAGAGFRTDSAQEEVHDIMHSATPQFEEVWSMYDRKDAKQNAVKAWNKLSPQEKVKAFQHIPPYVQAHPDKQFRPMFATYLNQKRFNDDEIISNSKPDAQQQRLGSYAEAIASMGRKG